MTIWTPADIPTLHGKTAVVTGTGGLGFEVALELARAGADVVIAGRNAERGSTAVTQIRRIVPAAAVGFALLDLASLESIAGFAERLRRPRGIDLLVNNAAVMTPPKRLLTQDGYELQFGTNYLGHYALTAALLPLLRLRDAPRVVSVSSLAARSGNLELDDLQSERSYRPMRAYAQSKLACLMFALELQRRSDAGGWGITSVAAHPGISRTDLLLNAPGRTSAVAMVRRYAWFLFQPAAQGALPTLFAATSDTAAELRYVGPDRLGEMRGHPVRARIPPQALDVHRANALWETSARLARAQFPSTVGRRPEIARFRPLERLNAN